MLIGTERLLISEGGVSDLVHRSDRAAMERSLANSLYAGNLHDVDFRITKGGLWRRMRGQVCASDGAGHGILLDIGSRRSAQLTNSRLAAIVASSDDAIVGMTLDGIVTDWNSAAENIFGYTAAEIIGQSIEILLPENLQHEERDILARVRKGRGSSISRPVALERTARSSMRPLPFRQSGTKRVRLSAYQR